MVHKSLLLALLLCLMVLLLSNGCQTTPSISSSMNTAGSTIPSMETSQLAPEAIYQAAIDRATKQNHLTLLVTYTQDMSVAGETFTSHITQTIQYQNMNTLDFRASVAQVAVYGDYLSESIQYFSDGRMYTQLSGKNHVTNISQSDFIKQFAPLQLLDPSNYKSVTVVTPEKLQFSSAVASECWLVHTDAVLSDAQGSVHLNPDGSLSETNYTVHYTYGPAAFHYSVNLKIITESTSDFAIPEEKALVLESPESLFLLERAFGYLLQTKSVTSSIEKITDSQAAGILRNHNTGIITLDTGEGPVMHVEQSVRQVNITANSTEDEYRLKETFQNGQYTYTENDGIPIHNNTFKAADMRKYVQGLLCENILNAAYINGAVATDLNEYYLVDFTCDNALGSTFCTTISTDLFDDPDYLNKIASIYTTDTVTFSMTFDKYTHLPRTLETFYVGTHTIYETLYPLTLQIRQDFHFDT